MNILMYGEKGRGIGEGRGEEGRNSEGEGMIASTPPK